MRIEERERSGERGYQDEGDGLVEVLRDLLGGDQVVLLAFCNAREQKEKVEVKRWLVQRERERRGRCATAMSYHDEGDEGDDNSDGGDDGGDGDGDGAGD